MIHIYCEKGYKPAIRLAAQAVFARFGIDKNAAEAEIGTVSADEIRALNNERRNIDSVTDVLSFPSLQNVRLPIEKKDYPDDVNPETGCVMLGEVYLCVERAAEQAEEYGHSMSRELGFLTAHGLLHLLGYDHVTDENAAAMEKLQEEILASVGLTRDAADEDFADAEDIEDESDEDEESEEEAEEEDEEEDDGKGAAGDNESAPAEQHTGYIAILGRPNAGKSTLINTLVGEKVSIVSWKPQTTRNKILGVKNDGNYQLIFVDTPGLHAPRNALGEFMMKSVTAALESVDVVLYIVDGEKGLLGEDKANIVRYVTEGKMKVVVAVNKIDHITREKVGEMLTELSPIQGISAIVPLSALRNKNVEPLVAELKKLIPVGEKLFPDDVYTDRSVRFMASEIIREKAFRLLDKEVPYGIGIEINEYKETQKGLVKIDASVIIQKAAHKPIILGKGGEMIKKISTYARQDIEEMTGSKVFLTLWVKVKEDWRDDPAVLNEIGYTKKDLE